MRPYLSYLRIGWSVACVFVFVALIVFSYWRMIWLGHQGNTNYLRLAVASGQVRFIWTGQGEGLVDQENIGWLAYTTSPPATPAEVKWSWDEAMYFVVPIWSFTPLTVVIAAAPWIVSRFSLRMFLIVTTLVAVLMGAVVFQLRK